jgi:hypothetical protein
MSKQSKIAERRKKALEIIKSNELDTVERKRNIPVEPIPFCTVSAQKPTICDTANKQWIDNANIVLEKTQARPIDLDWEDWDTTMMALIEKYITTPEKTKEELTDWDKLQIKSLIKTHLKAKDNNIEFELNGIEEWFANLTPPEIEQKFGKEIKKLIWESQQGEEEEILEEVSEATGESTQELSEEFEAFKRSHIKKSRNP